MSLSNADFALLQENIDAIVEKIASLRLNLVVETDFRGLGDFMRSVDYPFVNPTFDPVHSDLAEESFWLRVTDEDGNTIACHAEKVFETDDFCSLLEDGRLWRRDGVDFRHDPPEVIRPAVPLRGRVTHAGSLWIHPMHRKKGLSLFLPYLSRAICLRNFETDYNTGLVLQSLSESVVPRRYYGFPHVELCFRGWFPPTQRREQGVHLCYISQAEGVARIHELGRHAEYPVPILEPT